PGAWTYPERLHRDGPRQVQVLGEPDLAERAGPQIPIHAVARQGRHRGARDLVFIIEAGQDPLAQRAELDVGLDLLRLIGHERPVLDKVSAKLRSGRTRDHGAPHLNRDPATSRSPGATWR